MKEKKQRIVLSKSDIPDGFVPLASYGAQNPKKKIKSSKAYTKLSNLWQTKQLAGVKLMRSVADKRGHVYVCKVEADELIASKLQAKKTLPASETRLTTKSNELTSLLTQLQATNEKMLSLISQVQSAIRAEHDDKNLTLFN